MISNINFKNLITKIPYMLLFLVALFISSGLSRIVMAIFLVITIICKIIGGQISKFCILFILIVSIPLGLYANIRGNSDIFSYHVTNQSLYQPEFYEQQIFPDTYIRELIEDKTVIIPYVVKEYDDYTLLDEETRESDFKNLYYRENNYARFFNEYANRTEVDLTLPKVKEVKTLMEDKADDFTNFGCANDMLRYSFLLNKEKEKEMSYFWYSWFYYSFSIEKEWYAYVYINPDDLENADKLVAIWDRRENLYLMSQNYYEENIK